MQPSETSKVREAVWPWVRTGVGLDVGCGPDKVHPECTGVDAGNYPNVIKGSAEKLTFGDSSFDWVYSAHCLEHLDQPETAIAEMVRVLKPDGTLILYLPYADWYDKVYPNTWHKHQFRPSDIRSMVKKHWPKMWVVTEELRGGPRKNDEQEYGFLLILKREEPKTPKKFLIRNWPNIGDTVSLDALLRVLPTKHPDCEIYLDYDNAGLFTDMPWVKVLPKGAPRICWDGMLTTLTFIGQYHNYLRREKHFYAFPIWIAITQGWLTEDDLPEDVRPKPLQFTAEEKKWAAERAPKKPFVALVHHAGHFPRDWYNDRWQRVVQWLTERGILVIAFGTKSPGFTMSSFIDMTGKTTLRQAACLASKAKCAIGVDTGMFHLLPMFNVPCLVLSGPSRFDTTFSPPARAIYRYDAGCQQCYNAVSKDWFSEGEEHPIHPRCDHRRTACMEAISVGRVIAGLADMLDIKPRGPGLLSVCMIVHNEEKSLAAALRSVCEHADEIIVVDTGSTDRTKEIAIGFPKVKLFDFDAGTPITSFSAARNFAFAQATSKYAMWLDASNVVSDLSAVTTQLVDGNYDLIRLFTKSGGSLHRRDRVCLSDFAMFTDRVHETMMCDGLRATTIDCVITRTWQTKVGREDSIVRNIRLLRLMLAESPNHPRSSRWLFYLARELRHAGEINEALAVYHKRVAAGGFWEERAQAALAISHIHKSQGDLHQGLLAAYDALKYCDGWRDAYYLIADCYFGLRRFDKAIAWLHHAMTIATPTTILWKWESIYQYLPQLLLSMCHYELKNYAEALRWARDELANAPQEQHPRILARIKQLEERPENRAT